MLVPNPIALFPCYLSYFAWFLTFPAFHQIFLNLIFLPLAIFPYHLQYFAVTLTFPYAMKLCISCHLSYFPVTAYFLLPPVTFCSHSIHLAETFSILSNLTPKPLAIFLSYWPYFVDFLLLLHFTIFFLNVYLFLPLAIFSCQLQYFNTKLLFLLPRAILSCHLPYFFELLYFHQFLYFPFY